MNLVATDLNYLQAAEDWLDLGSPAKALAKLERIDPVHHSLPEVLLLRARIYLLDDRPHQARAILSALSKSHPELPGVWFFLACISARRGNAIAAEIELRECNVAAHRRNEGTRWQELINYSPHFKMVWVFNQLMES